MNIFLILNVKNLLIELLIISAVCSAILVIISKNPVISVIFLISLVLTSALFLVVKGMPFLGISYVLIYLGAIIVLFLFVIMMINVRLTDILETGAQYTKNIPLALAVSGLFLYEFFNVLPSYLNSSIFSLDYSIMINLSKEIVLTLNDLFSYAATFIKPGYAASLQAGYVEPQPVSFFNELPKKADELLNLAQGSAFQGTVLNGHNLFNIISNNNWPETLIGFFTPQQIISVSYSLYTYGAFLFLILGMILLLAMIVPIYISRK
jgi:NADH-ubiquinone oxidoreductase chain 6